MQTHTIQKPELLAPAGNWASLRSAVDSGCDAVYFGIKGINMRHAADNFDILEIRKIMKLLHENNKKGYLTLNVIMFDGEQDKFRKILIAAKENGVDAVILWDMGVLGMAKEIGLEIHLSTQASVSNFAALKEYNSRGVKRVVLARECELSDVENIIERIDKEKIDCGVETFVHGALCVSISGRCFLSQYSFGKSANRGECLQPCRREFAITDHQDNGCNYVIGEDYILSPKDLCTIEFLDKLITAGIGSFKIEGRMRPPEYVKIVTSVYREAIDAFFEGNFDEKMKADLLRKLELSFNRGFSRGFYFGRPDDVGGQVSRKYEKIYLGEVVKFYKKINVAEIMIKNKSLKKGDKILVSGKSTPAGFAEIEEMEIDHGSVDVVDRGVKVGVKLPFVVRRKDKVFIWREDPVNE